MILYIFFADRKSNQVEATEMSTEYGRKTILKRSVREKKNKAESSKSNHTSWGLGPTGDMNVLQQTNYLSSRR